MIENNPVLSGDKRFFDARLWRVNAVGKTSSTPTVMRKTARLSQSTAAVDNFVGNWVVVDAKARKLKAFYGMLKT